MRRRYSCLFGAALLALAVSGCGGGGGSSGPAVTIPPPDGADTDPPPDPGVPTPPPSDTSEPDPPKDIDDPDPPPEANPPVPPPEHSITVDVNGLRPTEQITLSLNGGNPVTLTGDTRHTFPGTYPPGASYSLEISDVSSTASCSINAPAGQVVLEVWIRVACRDRTFDVRRVADVNVEIIEESSSPQNFVRYGSFAAFAAWDSPEGRLFLTDGTAAGTFTLTDGALDDPRPLIEINGKLIFLVRVPGGTQALYVTEGVPGDAREIAPVTPVTFTDIGGRLLFYGQLGGYDDPYGRELWTTDGTPGGSHLVKDILPGPQPSNRLDATIVALNGFGFFRADDGTGQRLWRSDGSSPGTQPVTPPDLPVHRLLGVHNGRIYFVGPEADGRNRAIWVTDGTSGGETLAADLRPGGDDDMGCFTAVGDTLYFVLPATLESPTTTVWATRGALGDRVSILATGEDGCGFVALGAEVYFVSRGPGDSRRLMATNGTAAGTRVVVPEIADVGYTSLLLPVNDRLLFARETPETGAEFWFTDGENTALLLDANPGPASGIEDLIGLRGSVINGRAYLPLSDGLTGTEPWVSDGTAAGTFPLANVAWETRTANGVRELLGYTSAGVFFSGCPSEEDCELWITDGTEAGTREVVDLGPGGTDPTGAASINDVLVFRNSEGGPWVSDGTAAGTYRLGPSGFLEPSVLGNRLYFVATGTGYRELWRTDGTLAGTALVSADRSGWRPDLFTPFQGLLYFHAHDTGLDALYRTDGSPAGTLPVAPVSIYSGHGDSAMVALGNDVLLFPGEGPLGVELWRSDGTEAGTALLADIWPGEDSGAPTHFAAFDGEIYFRARDGSHRWGLWASDGTNVRLVRAFHDDSSQSQGPRELFATDDALYFLVERLWKSDGTADGTVPLEARSRGRLPGGGYDLTPADQGVFLYAHHESRYRPFVITEGMLIQVGDQTVVPHLQPPLHVPQGPFAGVYFVAEDLQGDRELWVLKPDDADP